MFFKEIISLNPLPLSLLKSYNPIQFKKKAKILLEFEFSTLDSYFEWVLPQKPIQYGYLKNGQVESDVKGNIKTR